MPLVVQKGEPKAAAPAARPTSKAKPARKSPATKRAGRDPLKVLGLGEPAHALLAAPAQFIDCRQPITRVHAGLIGDETPRVYLLRFSGSAFGRDKDKNRIWEVPSEHAPDIGSLHDSSVFKTRSFNIKLLDERGTEVGMWVFGLPTAWTDLTEGAQLWVYGTIQRFGSQTCVAVEHRVPHHAMGSIWARYAGRPGQITGERVETTVRVALNAAASIDRCVAWISGQTGRTQAQLDDLVREAGFDGVRHMLMAMHAPRDVQQGEAAIRMARRLSAIAMEQAAVRSHTRLPAPRAPIPIARGALDELGQLLASQGRPLTGDQRKAAGGILEGLTRPTPMSALLSGDVGTGKTLTYAIPAVAAHMAGAQVAIVAPVRLLADQIARELLERFGSVVRGVQRVEAGGSIDDPSAILVGTQGLLNAAQRCGYIPNVLIFDEQHRMSAEQRDACVASHTHALEVSATPIPRTLAASIYASIEQFQLHECPVRKDISSRILSMADKSDVLTAIRGALARGERCAIIYPRVTPAEGGSPHESVTGAFASFLRAFPNDAVMIHGELSTEEIDTNLRLFRDGTRRLAIASTVLEIGIDVPSISVMVVRGADKFGMSQLHQLRGRLARNGGRGDFFMVVEDPQELPPETMERLRGVRATLDGYQIAEQDLLLRGFGDLDGTQQSGESDTLFKLVKLTAADFVGGKIDQRRAEQAAASRPVPTPAPALAGAPAKKGWQAPAWLRRAPLVAPSPTQAPAPTPSDDFGADRNEAAEEPAPPAEGQGRLF